MHELYAAQPSPLIDHCHGHDVVASLADEMMVLSDEFSNAVPDSVVSGNVPKDGKNDESEDDAESGANGK
jgi:hypothetical protein